MYATNGSLSEDPKLIIKIRHGHWAVELKKHLKDFEKIQDIGESLNKLQIENELSNDQTSLPGGMRKQDVEESNERRVIVEKAQQKTRTNIDYESYPRLKSKLKTNIDLMDAKRTQVNRSAKNRLLKRLRRYFNKKKKVRFDL